MLILCPFFVFFMCFIALFFVFVCKVLIIRYLAVYLYLWNVRFRNITA